MTAALRFSATAMVAALVGCTPPQSSICVDGRVWEPQPGTAVATPVGDGTGWQMRCIPVAKDRP